MFPYEEFTPVENQSEDLQLGKSFLFDFIEGDFVLVNGDLKTIEGIESLKIWITKSFSTLKDNIQIYLVNGESYGVNFKDIITSSEHTALIYANIQDEISSTLLSHPDIFSLDSFNFDRDKRALTVSFNINTRYGNISEVVNI